MAAAAEMYCLCPLPAERMWNGHKQSEAMIRAPQAGFQHSRRAALAASVFAIALAWNSSLAARAASSSPAPIVFDTDFGSGADEAFALAFILGSPELELRGVTTVSGDTQVRALMVCRFLTMTGRRHTAVAAGSPPQPARDIGLPYQYYYHPDVLFHRTSRPQEESAWTWLRSRLEAEPGALTLLASGPLTNIGRLLREHPESRDQIQRIVWVGGFLGAEPPPDEALPDQANLRSDPAAAQEILASGIPLLIIPAEVAAGLTLNQDQLREVFRPGSMLTNQVRALHQLEGGGTVALGAAFAAALCFTENFAELEERHCEIDPRGILQMGSGPPNARVAIAAKRDEFSRFYIRRLAALLPPASRPVRPLDGGSMPARVHVAEDYETDIERRWWMCGVPETEDVPPGSNRVCRGVLTHDFDDLLGDAPSMHTAVIFNPVPGPPMGPNTRLSFRYRLTGAGRLRVQIYSLTNGFHRHLVVEGLSQERWDSATVDLTLARRADGTGGPLSEDERIDDIQFYASPEAELIIDDIVLYEAAAPEETRPFPRRVLFTGWFDTGEQGREWPGAFDIAPLPPPGKWKAARSVPGPDGAPPWLRVHLRGERSLDPSTQLRFRCRLTGAQSLTVQLVDGAGNVSAVAEMKELQENTWTETTLDLTGPDPASDRRDPRPGARVEEIVFRLPGQAAELLIDDLLLFDPGSTSPATEAPSVGQGQTAEPLPQARGLAAAVHGRPAHFPHRIWAACDFEGQTPDYGWFGPAVVDDIPRYPGNRTALGVGERPYGNFSAIMTGINPVPGPRIGKHNKLYLRYRLEGTNEAVFQHFSLTSEDNQHVRVRGLRQGQWAETVIDFTGQAVRNDGSPQVFQEGERMDDFKIFAGDPGQEQTYDLLIDDVIFFAEDPAAEPEPEPFPNRIIFLAAFDTGPQERYWPGEFALGEEDLPAGSSWRVAQAVPREAGAPGKWIRLQISPPRPVGERTRLRFRYHLRGAHAMTVQIFDCTVQDNRHVRLDGLIEDAWTTAYVDFTRDSRRNDGSDGPFSAGNTVDDLFFFVEPASSEREAVLLIDEVVLYDAGEVAAPAGSAPVTDQ